MIISTSWLADYVRLPASTDELVSRLLLSGLNHEATWTVGADTAIELEVTSNRPDCLGHVGVAREVAVLTGAPLHLPDPRPVATGRPVADRVAVTIEAGDICPCYSARVIRGVRVGPSPDWLVDRLRTVGLASINNVVDITNYVMLETGQPLHAFDLARLGDGRIVVRRARAGEPFTALNHKTYLLDERMCVIAAADRPIALAGVMGGADTEIGPATTDVLLESAQFAPLPVRAAARGLVLASPSSYRFERGPDPALVDWASRRAGALILELAGGVLDAGVAEAGLLACSPALIPFDPGRVATVLGVAIAEPRQRAILTALGFVEEPGSATRGSLWRAPTWRRDAWREIDLVEEIARIEGYDRVPETVSIAARPVEWSDREITVRTAAGAVVAAGLCEALTRSVVSERHEALGSPWTDSPPLVIAPPLVRSADRLRRSLLPSLLEVRSDNAACGTSDAELFEIARGYCGRPGPASVPTDPTPVAEPLLLGLVTGGPFARAKGLCEAVLAALGVVAPATDRQPGLVDYRPFIWPFFAAGRAAEILLVQSGTPIRVGVVGEVAADVLAERGLAGPVAAAELRLDLLQFAVRLERPIVRPSDYPAVERDLNLVLAEAVPWAAVEAAIRSAAGTRLAACRLVQVWRDAERLGPDTKSFVVSLRLQSDSGTLSGEDAGRLVEAVVAACGQRTGAVLRG